MLMWPVAIETPWSMGGEAWRPPSSTRWAGDVSQPPFPGTPEQLHSQAETCSGGAAGQ